MQQYNLNKVIGVVEVPHDCMQCYVHHYGFLLYNTKTEFNLTIDLPDGNWQFLSLASDITEEKAKQLGFDTLESLRNWERSKGIVTVNPLGAEIPKCVTSSYDKFNAGERLQNRWIEAQQQVVNIAYLIKG